MKHRRDRVQWVYAAKNNQELEERYDAWACESDTDLADEFEWIGPRAAVALCAKHVPPTAKILDAGAGTGSSASACSLPDTATCTQSTYPKGCSIWRDGKPYTASCGAHYLAISTA